MSSRIMRRRFSAALPVGFGDYPGVVVGELVDPGDEVGLGETIEYGDLGFHRLLVIVA